MKKIKVNLIITATVITIMILIVMTASLLRNYFTNFYELTEKSAISKSYKLTEALDKTVDNFTDKAVRIADNLPDNESDTLNYLLGFLETDKSAAYIRYIVGNNQFTHSGNPYAEENSELTSLASKGVLAVSGLIYEHTTNMSSIVVYAPAPQSAYADGILMFFSAKDFYSLLEQSLEQPEDAAYYRSLCTVEGTIVNEFYKKEIDLQKNQNFFDSLRRLINSKPTADKIQSSVKTADADVFSVEISGKNYIIAVATNNLLKGRFFLTEILDLNTMISSEKEVINTFSGLLIVIAIVLILLIIYIAVDKRRIINALDKYEFVDPILGCPTFKKFTLDVEEILSRNKVTRFSLIYLKIIHYEFITDNLGEEAGEAALRFLVKAIEKSLLNDESLGHISGNKFAILMHHKNDEDLRNRLNMLNIIFYNCPSLKEYNYNMRVSFGVYSIDRENPLSVNKMLENAIVAQETTSFLSVSNINIFQEDMNKEFRQKAEIETRMESSLSSGEFVVFYQPKYNISQNRPDGCEALVRWYYPSNDSFRNPEEFLPVFEANGFITKLDKYIFAEVCKFIAESIKRGDKVVPVSVNASRVTAIQEGFVDYYIHTKNKYHIADGFLTIEFTESFAFENYGLLRDIIEKLRRNGFKCSIDDFGAGYSSFKVLKDLPMDELKLDRFFVLPGMSKERDNKLLGAMILIAKSMGMKITQEGVETKEELDRLRKLGCDVVQGYYYSRPLGEKDYVDFINNKGSL
ncbi:MAG TPA: hypothetical protein DD733_03530 [Clostridiales bacterium]|nr:bifunctional diguanylate cyclase/phosphodiesterase [Eubacteriales bacterium]HBR31137.1 hypothetical protein [Clostridiales bacterium]